MPTPSIRSEALRWLSGRKPRPGHVVASKRYLPGESWTAEKAWWIQVPDSAVEAGKLIHILCQAESGVSSFRHLEVPAAFFRRNRHKFATIGEAKINLFLSAEHGSEFRDERGPGRVSLASFERL